MRTKMKRILSIALALCICLTMLPTVAMQVAAADPISMMVSYAQDRVGMTGQQLGYTDHWCAFFVCNAASYAGQSKAIPYYGYVPTLYREVLKAGGRPVSSPQKGDLVFYNCTACDTDGDGLALVHVGLMVSESYSIEGNLGGTGDKSYLNSTVKQKGVNERYSHGSGVHNTNNYIKRIYVRPAYDGVAVGPHTCDKGEYVYYQAVHPHYNCYRCSMCSEVWADAESSNYVSSCLACQEPGKSTITGMQRIYASGSNITFNWTKTENTTHYNIWIQIKNDQGEWQWYDHVCYATSGYQMKMLDGQYRCLIQSYNSNYWKEDGSDWLYTESDYVYFVVGEHDCDKSVYMYYEAVHPHYSCYQCSLCGVISRDFATTNYISSCLECNRPEKPALMNMKTDYLDSEEIIFTWDTTDNTTHYNFWLYVKNAQNEWEQYEHTFYVTSGFERTLPIIEYRCLLQSYNSNYRWEDGSDWLYTESDFFYFTVNHSKYMVSYNANGGSGVPSMQTVDAGSAIGTMPVPTKEGYDFAGWYESINGNYNPVTSETVIEKDLTLYAHWMNRNYQGNKVEFETSGGQFEGDQAVHSLNGLNIPRGQAYLVIFNCGGQRINTNKWGVEFVVNSEGSVVGKREYEDDESVTVPAAGFVLSGHISAVDPTVGLFLDTISIGTYVGYDKEKGMVYSYSTQDLYLVNHKFVEDGMIYGKLPVPQKAGYEFEGWYTDPEGGELITETSSYSVSTLFAHWKCIHDNVKAIEYIAPSCEEMGTMAYYICSNCGKALKSDGITETTVEAEMLLPLGHDFANATCTTPKICKNCGITTGTVVEHSYSYTATKNPTTSATGTLTGTCSKCKETTTVTLPKLTTTDYTYAVKTAATCTADGTGIYTWKTTTYGSFSFNVTLTKTGHSYSYAATKNPTTSATGTLTGTCSKCKGTTTVTLPKLNTTDYTYAVKMAATCIADGSATYTWINTTYGNYSFDVTLAETGHSYDNGKITVAATCTQNGVKTYTCSSCGDTYTDSIASTGHQYQYGVCIACGTSDPNNSTLSGTVTSFGSSTDTVTMCIYKGNSNTALRTLTIKNGSFMIVGLPAGEYKLSFSKQNHVTWEYVVTLEGGETVVDAKICLFGDVTGDGRINVADTGKVYAHVKGTAELTDYAFACADVSGDGKINVADTGRIYAHVKGTKELF